MLPTQGATGLVKNAHRGTRARPGFVGTASGAKTCNGLVASAKVTLQDTTAESFDS